MRAPDGLGAAGKKAWARAKRAIEDSDDPDRLYDLAARYAYAIDVSDRARREWRKQGSSPTVDQHGAEAQHPLLKVMNEHDKSAHRYGRDLKIEAPGKQKHRGPNPQAVVQADIGASPAQRLRSVS